MKAVVITGALDKLFCAGANIQMLATSTHAHKVGFCKFTNETRNGIEEMSAEGGQVVIAALNGTAAGGGYELALACDEILLVDDRASAVSLPEVPLLAVLPGTGGLTRVVDKRHVRRDLADVFSTKVEGIKGKQAVEWGLVDAIAPPTAFAELVRTRAVRGRPSPTGPTTPWESTCARSGIGSYPSSAASTSRRSLFERSVRSTSPSKPAVSSTRPSSTFASTTWSSARGFSAPRARERTCSPPIARSTATTGSREVRLFWKRTLKRLDMSARTLIALVTPGSCFAGTLAELALAADRTLMLDGDETVLQLTAANDGWYPMANGLSRLATRFWGRDDDLARARALFGKELSAAEAFDAGLVTSAPDDLDWDDEVRILLEERASFSPDALTGMEANLRFPGPETMETKIFARLTAWQNWIFQRPNAVGTDGALQRYGTGLRPTFDRKRVG